MVRFLPEFVAQSRFAKATVGTIGVIVLGAIGSGLWEVALGPIVNFIARSAVRVVSSFYTGYLDGVYELVSRNPSDQLAALPYSFVLAAMLSLPWATLVYLRKQLNRIERSLKSETSGDKATLTREALLERVGKSRRSLTMLFVTVSLFTTVIYSADIFKTSHARNAALFVERSIEIVAPCLSEQDRLELRSLFRSIESASDFYKLEDRLRIISEEYSIVLPDFESIR